jgi:hypothetical protein
MLRVSDSGRTRWVRTLPLVAVMAVMVLAAVPAAGASSIPSTTVAPSGGHIATAPRVAPGISISPNGRASTSTPPTLNPTPSYSPSGVSFSFFQNNSTFAQAPVADGGCQVYNFGFEIQNQCVNQAVDPSAVLLGNGNIGVGYTIFANVTGNAASGCVSGATNSTVAEKVGFSISSDNGATFGPIDYLGNQTCSYLDAVEPSFAVGPTGTVYGAYVQENFSGNVGTYADNYSASHTYCYYYPCPGNANRSNDSLGFTVSTDNGVSFTAPVTISTAGWIAHPQVAVFGQSVYVLYENINNLTSGLLFPYGYGFSTYYDSAAIELELLYSPNGGSTWSGPYTIPGITGISGIAQEAGGAIAVSSTGTVAISYFTDDSCGALYYSSCYGEATNLTLATSTTNGTSFKGPYLISSGWGSTPYYFSPYYDYNYGSNFEMLPASSIAFSPSGSTVYIGWTAAYNESALFGGVYYPYELYEGESGAFEATGSVAGTGFTTHILMASAEEYNDQFAYSPAIEANAGGVYMTYSGFNETYCYFGEVCSSYVGGTFFQVVQTSPNGVTWSGPAFATFSYFGDVYNAENAYPGYYSSATFTSTGAPVYAYALPDNEIYSYNYTSSPEYFNYSEYPTLLYVATNYSGPTLSLNVTENGLPGTIPWTVEIGGAVIDVPAGVSNFTVSGIAIGQTVLVTAPNVDLAPGVIGLAGLSVTGGNAYENAASFEANGTIYVNYTDEFALWVSYEPTDPTYAYIEVQDPCCNEVYIEYFCTPVCIGAYPGLPWYYPANTSIRLYTYGEPLVAQFWTGTGNGSYTGTGYEANLTMLGPINETAWFVPIAQYNVTVNAPGLPAGSTYSFVYDGTTYSGSAGTSVTLPDITTGSYYLSAVSATSATSGWSYVGTAADYQPYVVPTDLTVNLAFALVDTGASLGVVTFQAQGFTPGTPWQMSFNATTYSSSTPWINVTTRPGTFQTSVLPAVAANGSVGYAPVGVPSDWAVQTGNTYQVNFSQAYRVATLAGTGGAITGGGAGGVEWVLPGASVPLTESAHSGYVFLGWSGVGLGSYTGTNPNPTLTIEGPVTEAASFAPLPGSRFNMSFTETGLATGTLWTAYVGGIGYSGTGSTIVVGGLLACGAPGALYNISVPTVYASNDGTRYIPTLTLPKTQCTTGTAVVHQSFATQYYVSIQSTPGGYATATVGSSTTNTGFWVPSGTTVGLTAYVQPGYDFLGWNGSGPGNYSGTLQIDTIVIAGPVLEVAAFALPVTKAATTYWLAFTLSAPLSAGTAWTVSVGTTGYTSTGSSLTITGLAPGSYALSYSDAYSPDGQTKYTAVGDPTSVSLTTNKTLTVGFSASYWLSVTAGVGGTIVSPLTASGWVAAGTTETLNASASDGYEFVSWVGTGSSAYTGPSSTDILDVRSPVTEVATFQLIPSPPSTSQAPTSFLAEPIAWIGLGLIGLLVGLVVGIMVARRGKAPPPAMATPAEGSASTDSGPTSMNDTGDGGGSS